MKTQTKLRKQHEAQSGLRAENEAQSGLRAEKKLLRSLAVLWMAVTMTFLLPDGMLAQKCMNEYARIDNASWNDNLGRFELPFHIANFSCYPRYVNINLNGNTPLAQLVYNSMDKKNNTTWPNGIMWYYFNTTDNGGPRSYIVRSNFRNVNYPESETLWQVGYGTIPLTVDHLDYFYWYPNYNAIGSSFHFNMTFSDGGKWNENSNTAQVNMGNPLPNRISDIVIDNVTISAAGKHQIHYRRTAMTAFDSNHNYYNIVFDIYRNGVYWTAVSTKDLTQNGVLEFDDPDKLQKQVTYQILYYARNKSNEYITHNKWSNTVSVKPLSIPTELKTEIIGCQQVRLMWDVKDDQYNAQNAGEVILNVYRIENEQRQTVSENISFPYTDGYYDYSYSNLKGANNVPLRFEWVRRPLNSSSAYVRATDRTINPNMQKASMPVLKTTSGQGAFNLSWKITEGWTCDKYRYKIQVTQQDATGNHLFETDTLPLHTTQTPVTVPNNLNFNFCEPVHIAIIVVDTHANDKVIDATPVGTKEGYLLSNSGESEIRKLSVSKGFHSDRVRIDWEVNQGNQFLRYLIFRAEKGNPERRVLIATVDTRAGITTYNYDDRDCIAGVYYDYTVEGQRDCGSSNTGIFTVAFMSSTGFSQPFGIVNGRVAYAGSTAVEGATIIVEGTGEQRNKAIDLSPKRNNYIEIPYVDGLLSDTRFSIQAWLNERARADKDHFLCTAYGKYMVYIQPNGMIVLSYFANNTGGNRDRVNMIFTNTQVPDSGYYHMTVTCELSNKTGGALTGKLYIDGMLKDSITHTNVTVNWSNTLQWVANEDILYVGRYVIDDTPTHDAHYDGYIDELRLWRKTLDADEIRQNYNTYISGKESDLAAYYRFDEKEGHEVFDMSAVGNVYNQNHGLLQGTEWIRGGNNGEIPSPFQLSIKGVTDRYGQFLINVIPYIGDGETYTVIPDLGVHKFEPERTRLYFSQQSNTHNNVNFTDVSSFKVTGQVTYAGGNYPVEGCTFKVDGRMVVAADGKPIESLADGTYEISVPIGIHELQVEKLGHVFVAGGYAKERGENINFQDTRTNINFRDSTTVKIVGRFTGGKVEHEKPLGFGESLNNTGVDTVTLVAKKNYKLSCDDDNNDVTVRNTFYHNNGEWKRVGVNTLPQNNEWKRSGINIREQDSTGYVLRGNTLKIAVSAATGEFIAYVPPVNYEVQDVSPSGYGGEILFKNEDLDLTNSAVGDPAMLTSIIRTWTDSVRIPASATQPEHYEAREMSDTIFCHKEWKKFYQTRPSFSVTQMDFNTKALLSYFGEKEMSYNPTFSKDAPVTIPLADPATGHYYFDDKPVFQQAGGYAFFLKAYEKYTNHRAGNVENIAPVKGGLVVFSNELDYENEAAEIELDDNGEAEYTFMAGAPDLTTGVLRFFATVLIDNIPYYWDFGSGSKEAWLLGSKVTGTDFMTAGPDNILAVVHDPPGSGSKAFLEKGTTITHNSSFSISEQLAYKTSTEISTAPKLTTFVGLGGGVILEAQAEWTNTLGFNASEKITYNHIYNKTTEFTERFETKGDTEHVGHGADVFLGNSTNIQYGYTNGISLLHLNDVEAADRFVKHQTADFVIAKSQGLAIGPRFNTFFAYTEAEIEEIMIPKWRQNLDLMLLPVGTTVDPATIQNPVYISKLNRDHPNYGKMNTDDAAFGTGASTIDKYADGPSYTTVFPNNFQFAKIDPKTSKAFTYVDSVMYYNQQIKQWIEVLAENEKAQVEMKYENGDHNYSFGSGATIDKSKSVTSSHTFSGDFQFVVGGEWTQVVGAKVNDVGLTVKSELTVTLETSEKYDYTDADKKTTGFHLETDGAHDEISVDYGMTKYGTYGFKARGGRTSCPYEPERKTKYYEPGKHVLSEGGMRIEVPKISVVNNQVLRVPDNAPAVFELELKNESETGMAVDYRLTVDPASNPDGAEIRVDGAPLGTAGHIYNVPASGVLKKTLTIHKGPNVVEHKNIKLILASNCESSVYDSAFVSAEFLRSCTDVNLRLPTDNWISNTTTGTTVDVLIDGYNVNYADFGYIELQVKPTSETQWQHKHYFFADSAAYRNSSVDAAAKSVLGSADTHITYQWDISETMDGAYEIRVCAVCRTSQGVTLSESYSQTATGIIDRVRPQAFGKPQPADGILRGTGDIMLQFNEEINEGKLSKNDFSIEGIQNYSKDDHFTSVHFNGAGDYMATEQEINLTDKSFTVEFWMKRNTTGACTVFSHGSGAKTFAIGFDASNRLQATVNGNPVNLNREITVTNIAEWGHYAFACNASNNNIDVRYAVGATSTTASGTIGSNGYQGSGRVFAGCNTSTGGFAAMDMHGLKLWDRPLSEVSISAGMYDLLNGNEAGLIAYWPMNEGKGTLIQDKARSKHALLHGGWKLLPEGYAIAFSGNDNSFFDIPTSTIPIDQASDFSVELWFRGDKPNSALFSAGRGDGQDYDVNGKMSIYADDKGHVKVASNGKVYDAGSQNCMDNLWHHVAVSVSRTGMANIFIDGQLMAYVIGTGFSGLEGADMRLGGRKWFEYTGGSALSRSDMPFRGIIDEVRIWNMAISKEFINTYSNIRLQGDEGGLSAYYPFDIYTKNVNDQKELTFATADQQTNVPNIPSPVSSNITQTNETAPVKDAGPMVKYGFNIVSNKDRIVLNLTDHADKIENTYITVTARQTIEDLHGNPMGQAYTWHAYIDRNFLKWEDNSLVKMKKNGENLQFTAKIVNSGGHNETFTIENIPDWLDVAPKSGVVGPTSSLDIHFTVHDGLNPGIHEETLNLHSNYSNRMTLQIRVGGDKPDWTVNPRDYESSMSMIGMLKINNIISSNENDMVGAFINGVCVGVASPKYLAAFDQWQVSLSIYYSSDNAPVEFRIWEANSGRIYAPVTPSDVVFKSNNVTGAPATPILFETGEGLLTSLYLEAGWNWVSFNVASASLQSTNLLMQGITNGDEVKSQLTFSRYDTNTGKWGNETMSGNRFKTTEMYMVRMNGNNTLSLTGPAANPATTPIELVNGWNWIGFIPQVNMTLGEAFAGANPQPGDIVKNMTSFAVYDNVAGWVGSLEYMRPGLGYMYKAGQNRTFHYPQNSTLSTPYTAGSDNQHFAPRYESNLPLFTLRNESSLPPENAHIAPRYESNLSLIAEVVTSEPLSPSARLLAKSGNEYRGISGIQHVGGKQLFFIPLYSNRDYEKISFVLENDGLEIALKENITFRSNDVVGSIHYPFILSDAGSLFNVYPNPFNKELNIAFAVEKPASVQIELIDLTGRLLFSRKLQADAPGNYFYQFDSKTLSSLESGFYIVRITQPDKEPVTYKVIKF